MIFLENHWDVWGIVLSFKDVCRKIVKRRGGGVVRCVRFMSQLMGKDLFIGGT